MLAAPPPERAAFSQDTRRSCCRATTGAQVPADLAKVSKDSPTSSTDLSSHKLFRLLSTSRFDRPLSRWRQRPMVLAARGTMESGRQIGAATKVQRRSSRGVRTGASTRSYADAGRCTKSRAWRWKLWVRQRTAEKVYISTQTSRDAHAQVSCTRPTLGSTSTAHQT